MNQKFKIGDFVRQKNVDEITRTVIRLRKNGEDILTAYPAGDEEAFCQVFKPDEIEHVLVNGVNNVKNFT